MAKTSTNESCIMQLGGCMDRVCGEGSICPPPSFTPLILAFEFSSIFDIYQSYVEANSYQMSCINHNNKQDTDIIFHFGQNLWVERG